MGLKLPGIHPVHVAAWIEELGRDWRSAPTLKQHLAAVRMLFDWLVVGQVVPHNAGLNRRLFQAKSFYTTIAVAKMAGWD